MMVFLILCIILFISFLLKKRKVKCICLRLLMLSIPSTIFFTVIQFKQYFYHKLEIGGVIYAVILNLFNILFLGLLIY